MSDEILARLRRTLGSNSGEDWTSDEPAEAETLPARAAGGSRRNGYDLDDTVGASNGTLNARPIGAAALSIADQLLGTQPAGDDHPENPPAVVGEPEAAVRVQGALAPVTDEPLVLGRARTAFRPSDDARISRRHCAIQAIDGVPHVVDLGSKNGTQIKRGGARIVVESHPVALRTGDVVVTIESVVLAEISSRRAGE